MLCVADIPLPGHSSRLTLRDPVVLPGQMGYIVPPSWEIYDHNWVVTPWMLYATGQNFLSLKPPSFQKVSKMCLDLVLSHCRCYGSLQACFFFVLLFLLKQLGNKWHPTIANSFCWILTIAVICNSHTPEACSCGNFRFNPRCSRIWWGFTSDGVHHHHYAAHLTCSGAR